MRFHVLAMLATAAAVCAAGEEPAPNTLSEQEKAEGFALLFNGTDLAGWRGYKAEKPGESWVVQDGALTLTKKGGGDLMTAEAYGDFELRIDWKISPGGNSGIMYRVVPGSGAPYMTGPEVQVLDDDKHGDGRNPLTSSNACYAMLPATKKTTRPVGEWNQIRVILNGAKGEHWCNGEKVCEYEIGSADWEEKKAKSKWSKADKYAKSPSGHIVLQDHGNVVSYRNIKIKKLGAAK